MHRGVLAPTLLRAVPYRNVGGYPGASRGMAWSTAATGQNGHSGIFAGSSTAELEQWLRFHSVPVQLYGKGSARTVQELFEEVTNAESELTLQHCNSSNSSSSSSCRALRLVSVLNLYITNNSGQVLIEAGQRLPDGRLRHRRLPLSEKMIGREDWRSTAVRAVAEELGTVLPPDWNEQLIIDAASYQQVQELQESTSYPGLMTQYTCHRVTAELPCLPPVPFSTSEPRSNGGLLINYWEWQDPSPTIAAVMSTLDLK